MFIYLHRLNIDTILTHFFSSLFLASSFCSIASIFFHAFLTRSPKVSIPSSLTNKAINCNHFIKPIIFLWLTKLALLTPGPIFIDKKVIDTRVSPTTKTMFRQHPTTGTGFHQHK